MNILTDDEQLEIMRKQLELIPTLLEKLAWLHYGFGTDPMFSSVNIAIVRNEVAKASMGGKE